MFTNILAASFDVEDEEKHAESHNKIKDADSGNQQKIKKQKIGAGDVLAEKGVP